MMRGHLNNLREVIESHNEEGEDNSKQSHIVGVILNRHLVRYMKCILEFGFG